MNEGTQFFGEDEAAMEARLWAYIDGVSEEATAVEKLVAENSVWKQKYAELLDLHGMLATTELEQPSLRFAKNVMEAIARTQIAPAAKAYINQKIIWGIAAFFITVIVGFLGYGMSQVDWGTQGDGGTFGGVALPEISVSKFFSSSLVNGFLMLNVVLGLFLLDRYLNAKRRERGAVAGEG